MAISLLWKLPLLLTAPFAAHVATTPPTPPARADEQARFGHKDSISYLPRYFTLAGTGPVWLLAFAEAGVILAHAYPAHAPAFIAPYAPIASRLGLTPACAVGWALVVAGGALRKACYVTMGKQFTYQLALVKDHRLVTSGPYGVVRHPGYTGVLAVMAGMLLVQLTPGGLVAAANVVERTWWGRAGVGAYVLGMVAFCGAVMKRVKVEDGVLKREFGEEWEAWRERTPYALIPWLF